MKQKLTNQEQKIVKYLLNGNSAKEIANELNITVHTVDFHKTNIYRKYEVQNIQEFIAMYNSHNSPSADEIKNRISSEKRLSIPIILLITSVLINLIFLYFFIKPSNSSKAGISSSTSLVKTGSNRTNPITFDYMKENNLLPYEVNHIQSVSKENPFVTSLIINDPWNWMTTVYPSDFEGLRITEGDTYTLYYTFTSNVDFDSFAIVLYDSTRPGDWFFTSFYNRQILFGIKADTEYNGSWIIIPRGTASSAELYANLMQLNAYPFTSSQPTLTFTRFEIIKSN
jgi:DNA-binding CsgD family transcriptional regulator